MNTLALPGFTADASLYETAGHYRTCVDASNRRADRMRMIRLSAIDVPGEVIEIEDDAPWSPPSWGGHTGPGSGGGSGETGGDGGGPGGGDGGIPETENPPSPHFTPVKNKPCHGLGFHGPDIREGRYRPPKGGEAWRCCGINADTGHAACLECQTNGDDGRCHNGWVG
jgi:hypothetical protein